MKHEPEAITAAVMQIIIESVSSIAFGVWRHNLCAGLFCFGVLLLVHRALVELGECSTYLREIGTLLSDRNLHFLETDKPK